MEDTPEAARAMINPQTQSNLYGFDENETRSPSTISLFVRANPYNVITEVFHDRCWVSAQRDPRSTLAPYDEGGSIQLPPAPAISHSNGNHKHKGRPSSGPEHYRHHSEEIRVGDKERKGDLRRGSSKGKKHSRSPLNNNYIAVETERLTPPMSQRLPIVDQEKTRSRSMWTRQIRSKPSWSGQIFW